MMRLLLACFFLRASAAAEEPCWHVRETVAGREVHYAEVADPAHNFTVLHESKRFGEVMDLGVVVANGTFFTQSQSPLGTVVVRGRAAFEFPRPVFTTQDGRLVDLGKRWGIGVLAGSGRLALSTDEAAAATMSAFLGGGGLLLRGGGDASSENWGDPKRTGPNFPAEYRTRQAGRVALGVKDVGGSQRLIVLAVPPSPGSAAQDLAPVMRALGASDAVFYDGGGAFGFAAGPPGAKDVLILPSNPREDLNPTHIVVTSCR